VGSSSLYVVNKRKNNKNKPGGYHTLYGVRETLVAFQRSDGMILSLPRDESSKGIKRNEVVVVNCVSPEYDECLRN
jgi:hypothetical protein